MDIKHEIVTRKPAGINDKHPQAEIRFNVAKMTQVLIIVAIDGWNKDQYEHRNRKTPYGRGDTTGFQIRMSMNGPAWFTNDDWKEINHYIERVQGELVDIWLDRGLQMDYV